MTDIEPYEYMLPVSQRVERDITKRVDQMDAITTVAVEALDRVSNIHGYAQYKALTTTANTAHMARAVAQSVGMTPLEIDAYQQRTSEYLGRVNQIMQVADVQLVQEVAEVSRRRR